jgi:hypothetical protein
VVNIKYYKSVKFNILIFTVDVKYVKNITTQKMVKILYSIYCCGIHLHTEISSAAFAPLWISPLCNVLCSACRRPKQNALYTTYDKEAKTLYEL